MHRLKVYLCSTISEDRLNGLALLNVHCNIEIDLTEAVDQFAHARPRRLQLLAHAFTQWCMQYLIIIKCFRLLALP